MEEALISMDIEQIRIAFTSTKESGTSVELLRMMVENFLRKKALSIARLDSDSQEENLRQFLSLSFQIAKEEFCSKSMTVTVLQDIFDVISIKQCENLFIVVEDNISQWKTPFFFEQCRNMILRLCNDLLKRLSRTVDTSFCGRILVLLARALPLCEKSGLNLASQFNTDNVIKYELGEAASKMELSNSADEDEDMETGEIKEKERETRDIPVDYALYAKFWQLQSFFSSPTTCFDRIKWKAFQNNTSEVLSVLLSYKLDREPDDGREVRRKRSRTSRKAASQNVLDAPTTSSQVAASSAKEDCNQSVDDNFFAKYLTSQKLLQLQLNDSQFRRYFLVQCLILYQYLVSDIKFKDKSYVLSDDQLRFVIESTEKCYRLLRETHPYGNFFADSIKKILEREKEWSEWKNKGCADYTQLADKDKMNIFKKRPRTKYDPTKVELGNSELTKLWNINPETLSSCADPKRKFIPSLVDFISDPLLEADPEQKVEQQYKSVNDESFQWRCSRLLISESSSYFQLPSKKNEVIVDMSSFLEEVIKQTASTIPELKDSVPGAPVAAKTIDETVVNNSFALQNGKGHIEQSPQVSNPQITELAPLLAKNWIVLADALNIDKATYNSIEPTKAVQSMLTKWRQKEGSSATVKKLSSVLLTADLFSEQVGVVFKTSSQKRIAPVQS